MGGALPRTGGLKMFIALHPGGGVVVKKMAPYHVLAARGFPPNRVNLSTLSSQSAQRAANGAMPATAATACILAYLRSRAASTGT